MKNNFVYFTINHGLFRVGFELINIFGALYIFKLFDQSIPITFLILSSIYLLYPFGLILLYKIINRIGLKKSTIVGTIFAVFSLFPMAFFYTKDWIWFVLWTVLSVFTKVFKYIPYHYYAIRLTQDAQRGMQMSYLNSVMILIGIISPLIGGFALEYWGFNALLLICVVFIFLSILPLSKLQDYQVEISSDLFSLLKEKDSLTILAIDFINEMQGKEKFWEIYVFVILGMSFSSFGILTSVISLVTIPILIYIGKFSDKHNKKQILHLDGMITSLIWFSRFFVYSVLQVFVIDSLSQVNRQIKNQTALLITYDLSYKKNQANLIDERVVLRETFSHIFVGINFIIGMIIAVFFGLPAVFIFAGIVSLLFYIL